MIPFLLAIAFSILLTLSFVIFGSVLFDRWFEILGDDCLFNIDNMMKVPTFYSMENDDGVTLGFAILFPIVGLIFGGIHCAGWFFDFPSRDEAVLWRVSSVVLTGSAVLLPLLAILLVSIFKDFEFHEKFSIIIFSTILIVYVVSRLFLLVEALPPLDTLPPECSH